MNNRNPFPKEWGSHLSLNPNAGRGDLASSPPPFPPGLPHGVVVRTQPGVCVCGGGESASIRGKQGQRKGGGSHLAARVLAYNSQPPLGLPRGLPGVVIRSLRKGRRPQLIQGSCRTTAPSNPRAPKKGKACRELWFRAPRGAKGEPVKGRPSRSHGIHPPHTQPGREGRSNSRETSHGATRGSP